MWLATVGRLKEWYNFPIQFIKNKGGFILIRTGLCQYPEGQYLRLMELVMTYSKECENLVSFFDFFKKKRNIQAESETIIKSEEPISDTIVKQEKPQEIIDSKPIKLPEKDIYQEYYEHYELHRCPYCLHDFEKAVTRKRKCPSCQKTMIVRTHYSSKKKMLLKEELLEAYEKEVQAYSAEQQVQRDYEWAVKQVSSLGIDEAEVSRKKAEGYSIYDVLWGALNKKQMEYATKWQWGLYRNSFLSMADVLEREGRKQKAFHLYLGLCFIDLNGPRNSYVGDGKPFDPEGFGDLAPGILVKVIDFIKVNNLTLEKIREDFLNESKRVKNELMPLNPEQAWEMFKKELNKAEQDLAAYGYIKN